VLNVSETISFRTEANEERREKGKDPNRLKLSVMTRCLRNSIGKADVTLHPCSLRVFLVNLGCLRAINDTAIPKVGRKIDEMICPDQE
jgi:hypothetical protein